MRDDVHLDTLPEAVPLHRIAPIWRLLAIAATLATACLLFAVLIMGIVLANTQYRAPVFVPTAAPTLRPPPMAPGSAVIGLAPGVQDEAAADTSNLPYPVKADLVEAEPYQPVEENQSPPVKPSSTARERFLDQGTDLWKLKGALLDQLVISPDGEQLAYVADGNLIAGPIGSQRHIVGSAVQSAPIPVMPPGRRGRVFPLPTVTVAESNIKLLSPPAWSPDNRFVYCADTAGHLHRYDVQSSGAEDLAEAQVLAFNGESPVVLPTEPETLVFVRARPRPKLAVRGEQPTLDLTEVVLGDLTTQEIRVLVPAGTSAWRHPAVSPDGKRLALVSDRGNEGKGSQHLRVFVLDLAGGEPKPVSPPATQVGPVCWTVDGQSLVYARSPDALAADYWESEPPGPQGVLDLYHYDFAQDRETRLSRGGGCFSPSVSSKGDLYYLAVQEAGSELLLRRLALAAAREFAAREPQGMVRDAAAWTGLFNQILEESKITANLDGAVVTPNRLAETFNRLYRKHFQVEPPSTLKHLGRQRRELEKLNLSPALHPALTLILGALEGEYLVRHHGARWHLTKGPLLPPQKPQAESGDETSFGYIANPFATINDWARQTALSKARDRDATDKSLIAVLRRAEGRTLLLTNDPAAARAIVAELDDADLSRAEQLLRKEEFESAEQLLQSLLKQKRHEQNMYLGLQVGQLLLDKKRLDALQPLMEAQCERLPHDPRKFNLLGLALLEAQPRQAVDAFKNALRCDLRFEAAYLNLAQAYQLANDPQSARMCLQRYLAFLPDGVYTTDARRRLAAVDTNGK